MRLQYNLNWTSYNCALLIRKVIPDTLTNHTESIKSSLAQSKKTAQNEKELSVLLKRTVKQIVISRQPKS